MSDTRDKAALEHFEATTGGHWTSWPDSQQTDALQDFIAGWDAAVVARPLPDRMQIADEVSGIVVGSGYYSAPIGIDAALEVADAVLSLFTTDTTEEKK